MNKEIYMYRCFIEVMNCYLIKMMLNKVDEKRYYLIEVYMRCYLLKLIYKKSLHNRINDRKKKMKTSAGRIEFNKVECTHKQTNMHNILVILSDAQN
jgi:hypothetical protein